MRTVLIIITMLVTTLAAPCAIVKRTITPDGVAESINTGKKIIDWNYNGQRNGSIDVKTTSRIWASLGRDRLARYVNEFFGRWVAGRVNWN